MSIEMCHLHRHSEFSPLDGTGNANQYAARAVELGHKYIGLTDHATLGGALDHIRACREPEEFDRSKEDRIIPIVGCEVFMAAGESRFDKSVEANIKPHLCLHASGLEGWHSLLKVTTEAYLTGFHGVPRVDFDLLKKHNEGLIVTTACISSPLCRFILADDEAGARKWIEQMIAIFGDRFYFEIMGHDLPMQRKCNIAIIQFAKEYGRPLVATSDAHYVRKEDSDTQEIVFMMARNDTFEKRNEKSARGDEVYGKDLGTAYLMSDKEMQDLFAEHHPEIPSNVVDEAIANTVNLARTVKPYVVNRDLKLPKVVDSPDEAETLLREWIEQGFEKIKEMRDIDEDVYRERVEYEMGILKDKGVLDYFIIVGDLVRWAKSSDPLPPPAEDQEFDNYPEQQITKKKTPIRVALGRGSAAGCLVSYLIGITAIDPIGWDLMFERFLNPNRKGLPDIDLDFDSERRQEAKEYIIRKYGADHVADIITYQTFGPRASIGDISKVFGIPYSEVDEVKQSIGKLDKTIEKLVKTNESMQKFKERHPEVWKHAVKVDDMVRAPSKHAAGVIITRNPVVEDMPLQRSRGKKRDGSEDTIVTAWADRTSFPIISEFGFLKVDFLGIEGLTKHEYACKLIEERTGEVVDLDALPCLYDPDYAEEEVMDIFRQGLTLGIFQFGSRGITQLLRAMKPDRTGDIIAANALYRPGPMKFAFEYAKKKNGEEEVTYWHEAVIEFLEETYGILAYQEQVMKIVQALGDFSPGDSDDMRKAMGKLYKLPGDQAQQFMQKYYDQWVAGCVRHGLEQTVIDQIWQAILSFGDYAFNKSHSASYGLQAYQDAYLKRHYPAEFYAALLTYPHELSVQDIIREARILGVEILPPDVNESERGFTITDDGKLRYGLLSIDGIGGQNAVEIVNNRPYTSFENFLDNNPSFSIKESLNLLKGGAFESLGEDKNYLLSLVRKSEKTDYVVAFECGATRRMKKQPEDDIRCTSKACEDPDCSAVGWEEERPMWTVGEHLKHNRKLKNPRPVPEERILPSNAELAKWEESVLGINLSTAAVVVEYSDLIDQFIDTEEDIEKMIEKADVQVGGEVISVRPTVIKKGKQAGREMAFVDLIYGPNQWSCTLFADDYERYKEVLESPSLMIHGRKNTYKDKVSVVVDYVVDLEEFLEIEDDS